jgi:ABC-type oligopeptide transport system ATPase subunit
MSVIAVSGLQKRFNLEAGFFARLGRYVNAVNDVSFSIGENESYGLVGESGCGKTTTARLLVRMYEADGGRIIFRDDTDVRSLNKRGLRSYREKVKYVFQDPARSLNPRMSVYEVLVSGWRYSARRRDQRAGKKGNTGSRDAGGRRLREEAAAILEEVGLSAADLERRPSEFSGGQRQRISIARGLLMQPDLLICDEVVSALDVSIQGQILNLLLDIRKRRGLSFLFIAHDLRVASYFCDRIGVMYRGELMEEAPAADLYLRGRHPYTELLFSSVTGADLERKTPVKDREGPPPGAPANTPAGTPPDTRGEARAVAPATEAPGQGGCSFAGRCPLAAERCLLEHPPLRETESGRRVRCFYR